MKDLIYRQGAINAIENTECELLACEWDELTDAIKQVPSAQQWTPVSEGLPEKEVEVLVTTSWGNVCMAWCDNGKWRAEYINGYDDDEILAWMPLPEPYEGGDA